MNDCCGSVSFETINFVESEFGVSQNKEQRVDPREVEESLKIIEIANEINT